MAKLCAICGKLPATTVDHIPPKGLYTKPYPSNINFNTVPACPSCNNGSSDADEELKVMMGLATGEHQESPEAVIESLARTLGHNKKLARKMMESHVKTFAPLHSEVLEPAVRVTFSREHYRNVMARIVRGLYWMERGAALGLEPVVRIQPFDEITDQAQVSLIKDLMDSINPKHLNLSTFIYKSIFHENGSSIWGLMFFNRHLVICSADAAKPVSESSNPDTAN